MTAAREQLLQHLAAAAAAYGSDLPLAPGKAVPRQPAAIGVMAPAAAPAAAAAAASAAAPAGAPAGAPSVAPAAAAAGGADRQAAAAAAAVPAADDRAAALASLRAAATQCTRCKLHRGRNHVVFGEGATHPQVLFLGEAPGAKEDLTGRPFVGPAGQLLDRILQNAMGMDRSEVYIANINKCRPPDNRDPEPDEIAACLPFLQQQLAILRPTAIVCLGRVAARNLLRTELGVSALRGRDLDYEGIPVVVTWHPAYLLREPSRKRETWEDIKRLNRLLGRPEVPSPGSS